MEILLAAAVLTGGYFLLKAIYNYELKVAGISVHTEKKASNSKSKSIDQSIPYYASYRYLT